MIDTLVPAPAWQDEQMAAYVAARSSNDEAGQQAIVATIVKAFGPYLEFMAKSVRARIGSVRMLDSDDLLTVAKTALIKAIRRWRPEFSKELSRLASSYIMNDMRAALGKNAYGCLSVHRRALRKSTGPSLRNEVSSRRRHSLSNSGSHGRPVLPSGNWPLTG